MTYENIRALGERNKREFGFREFKFQAPFPDKSGYIRLMLVPVLHGCGDPWIR